MCRLTWSSSSLAVLTRGPRTQRLQPNHVIFVSKSSRRINYTQETAEPLGVSPPEAVDLLLIRSKQVKLFALTRCRLRCAGGTYITSGTYAGAIKIVEWSIHEPQAPETSQAIRLDDHLSGPAWYPTAHPEGDQRRLAQWSRARRAPQAACRRSRPATVLEAARQGSDRHG